LAEIERVRPLGETREDGTPIGVSLYKCPWCGEATNDAVVAQMHILEQHADVILGYYGETFRARGVVV